MCTKPLSGVSPPSCFPSSQEVIKEVRVEVPKIVHVPVEVIKEVPIEVIKYVDREVRAHLPVALC